MQQPIKTFGSSTNTYNPRFLKFIELLGLINRHEKLFPKGCRTCGTVFSSLSEYIVSTIPKGQSLDDCEAVMDQPWTMMYRHCSCGNTLVLTFTEETFPMIGELWAMLRREAEGRDKPLKEVVLDFVTQWERYVMSR